MQRVFQQWRILCEQQPKGFDKFFKPSKTTKPPDAAPKESPSEAPKPPPACRSSPKQDNWVSGMFGSSKYVFSVINDSSIQRNFNLRTCDDLELELEVVPASHSEVIMIVKK